MAWDWVQLDGGVVAMADPMAVVSNLRLIDAAGHVLTSWQAALHLNALVHGLPWQDEVCRLIDDPPEVAAFAPPAPRHAGVPVR